MCGGATCLMKDELIVGEHQVDGTRLLFLSFIVAMYWTKFLYEIVLFLYIILRVPFFFCQ